MEIYKQMLKKFNENYNFLYNHPTIEDSFTFCIELFEKLTSDEASLLFLNGFCSYRNDFVVSDREIIAYFLTLKDMEIL